MLFQFLETIILTEQKVDWLQYFPQLQKVDDKVGCEILANANVVTLADNQSVFHAGDYCSHYILVFKGQVRVQKLTQGGREIILYRIMPGNGCVLTTSCLIGGSEYPAEAVTETETCAAMIPLDQFKNGLANSEGFRNFVFESYGERLADLIMLIQEVAFGRVDARLSRLLLERAELKADVIGTHHALAVELGTAREVVSRYLKDFERHGWVKLSRGHVEIINAEALEEIVLEHPV